jgi:hypothetical protein
LIREDRVMSESGNTAAVAAVARHSSILNCSVTGNIDGRREVGGIAGLLLKSTLSGCGVRGKVSGNVDVGGLVGQTSESLVQNNWVSVDIVYRGMIPYDGKWNEKGPNYNFSASYIGAGSRAKGGGGSIGWADFSLVVNNFSIANLKADLETEKKYVRARKETFTTIGNFAGVVYEQTSFDHNATSRNANMEFTNFTDRNASLRAISVEVLNETDDSPGENVEFEWPPPSFEDLGQLTLTAGKDMNTSFDLGQEGLRVIPGNFVGANLDVEGTYLKLSGATRAPAGEYPVALVRDGETIFVRLRVEAGEN